MNWKEELLKHIAEEEQDEKEYMQLAEEACAEGKHREAGILRDIAHEESIHREMLYYMMK